MFKKLMIILILFYCLIPSKVFSATPQINSAPSGITNGSVVTITGLNFGINALDLEWTGNNIENGDPLSAFSKTNWYNSSLSSSGTPITYNNSKAHSGNKSLLASFVDVDGNERYRSTIVYDSGGSLTDVYITFWIYIDIVAGDSNCQWKSWRISDKNGTGGDEGIVNFNWINADTGNWNSCYTYFETNNVAQTVKYLSSGQPKKKWFRFESWVNKASGPGVSNGKFSHRIIDTIKNIQIASSENQLTHYTKSPPWRYIQFGEFYGNVDTAIDREAYFFYDDIYISQTKARVEIGNSIDWSNCTHREIQIPTVWTSDGTSITAKVNQGSFKTGESVYLFVVDANGKASNGYGPITIGDGPSPEDNQPPFTSGHSPSKNATGVAPDSNIVVHVQDTGDGVDQSTIVMKVNGKTVSPIIEGNSSNYTLIYDSSLDFNSGEMVSVTIEASDLHEPANVMSTGSYSFTIASAPPVEGAITKTFGETPAADYKNTVQDTFLNINTDINLKSQTLNTYTYQTNQPANAIIMKWDLSSIPKGAQIESANLYLYMTTSGGDTKYDISVHNIINHNPDLTKCTGFTYDGTNEWMSNNKCYNNIPLAQADIADAEDIKPINKTIGYKTWNVTNMIRDWINYPDTNYGLLINSDSTASSNSHRTFASSEASDANQRPKLVMSYSINQDTIPPRDVTGVGYSLKKNQLLFTWTNPKSAENGTVIPENQDFVGVMIRYNAGFDALSPASHDEGTLFYDEPGNLDENDSCTNIIVLNQDYKFSLFTYDSAGNYSQTVHITVDANPPGAVNNLLASSGDKQIILSWANPSDQDYAGTVIRYGTNNYPSDNKDGSLAVDKKGILSGNNSFVHGSLQNDLTYYYSAFAYDPSGNYSEAVNLSAAPRIPPDTTPPEPPVDADVQ